MAGKRWSYQETQMAFALYYLIPANEIDKKGAEVWKLAEGLGRTPRSVAMKLWNIASMDERRINLGKAGLRNASKLDAKMWEDFQERGDDFIWDGIALLDTVLARETQSPSIRYAMVGLHERGEKLVEAKRRVNQDYFRHCLILNYEGRCCLTGLQVIDLLIASHIKPWSECDTGTERVDPRNGLLLNALHDKAFDAGLITLTKDLDVVVSPTVAHNELNDAWLWRYDGSRITLPICNKPAAEFIEYHQDCVFRR